MDGADLSTTPAAPLMAAGQSAGGSRPSLGFPLGTALLLMIIFCISGVFSCCYHWDKLSSLRRRSQLDITNSDEGHLPPDPSNSASSVPSKIATKKQRCKVEKDQSLPVIMPGDNIPKFMAWPCPCPFSDLPATEKIMVEMCDLMLDKLFHIYLDYHGVVFKEMLRCLCVLPAKR